MKKNSLKLYIVLNFLVVILLISVSIGALGFHVIREEIIEKAQYQVTNYMNAARILYENTAASMGRELSLLTRLDDIRGIRDKIGLDYLFLAGKEDISGLKSEVAREAAKGQEISGTRIVTYEELEEMGVEIARKIDTAPMALPEEMKPAENVRGDAMAIEYARPIYCDDGTFHGVLYGGKIINGSTDLVDNIRDLIFGEELYMSKPVGTVTIFQGGVRIATNVIKSDGERAIGTRVSSKVYDQVIVRGETWSDRALVVNDWYITAYEPISNIQGDTIGMLYVGILEQPFFDMAKKVFLMFFLIMSGSVILAVIISFLLAGAIVRPVRALVEGTAKISDGDLESRIKTDSLIEELRCLEMSFNEMAGNLDKREKDLVMANEKREMLNKRYLDLISFVSHELKGILASTILNAYSVRDGFLGMVNFKQRKALDSVTRNLDHLDATVKNFLNLSRIEKGDMGVNKRQMLVKEDMFDVAVDTFQKQASEKEMVMINNIPQDLSINADRDLLQVVANNLVSNAVKYGTPGGNIKIDARDKGDRVEISVYNDGRVLTEEEKSSLFKRFSRLHGPETKNAKGTGLGLFISREIVEKHGGAITVISGTSGNSFVFEIVKGG